MIPLILKIFLSILLFYSSFVSVFINLVKKQFDCLSLFFSFSLCSLCLLLFYHLYQNIKNKLEKKETAKINNKNTPPPYFLALCFISLWIGFFNVSSQYYRGFQPDESSQFRKSLQKDTIISSYRQQQPPLDYYFSAFSGQLFQAGKFAVRFHTIYFYLLLCLLLPLGLYYYSSLLPAVLGGSLFLTNHVARLHAVDARPLNLALLTGFLFLFFYIQFFQSKQKQSLIPILSSQYLFTLSIGLQPVILIITLFISSSLFFFSQKESFKKLFISHIVTAGLSLPFYLKMINFGNTALKFNENISLSSLTQYFGDWNLSRFVHKYFFIFYDKMSLSFLVLVSAWLLLVALKKIKPDKIAVFLLSSTALFPVLFDSLFQSIINYKINNRYFITFSLLLIFCFVFICHFLNNYLKHKKYYLYIAVPFLMLFSVNTYLQGLKIKNETKFHWPYQDNNVEQVYNYLKSAGSPKDFFMEFNLNIILEPDIINVSTQKIFFHDSKTHPHRVWKWISYPLYRESRWLQIIYIDWNKRAYKTNQKVFFITENTSEQNISKEILSQFLPKKSIGQFAVFELTLTSTNKEQEYIHFLYKIKDKTAKKYQAKLLETLIYYSYKRKDKMEFNTLLQEYKKLREYLPKYTSDYNYPIHLDHQVRINFFESWGWD